ncbi:MAG: AAA family ATPase [Bacteroidia bacterium]|nr:AAA family ATPase [Bacteroidia bacterium]
MNELDKIFGHIQKRENFLLSGGAGSGKTYTLVEVLKRIYAENPLAKVACITYTNVATNEIKGRAPFENLYVNTIHSFLWDNIEQYQKNLKEALVTLVEKKEINYYKGEPLPINDITKIEYKEWKDLEKGTVSHEEVVMLAKYMVENYPLLARILSDKYDFIFIDEYQDTSKEVIELFLTSLYPYTEKCLIGLFGDSMQAIYDEGVGDVKTFIEEETIKEVPKEDNRRNPQIVIDLANQLRLDNLKQKHAGDKEAPNYGVEGNITFVWSKTEKDIEKIKERYFNFPIETYEDGSKSTNKELYLTHNLIAPKVGFPRLMEIYDKDQILKYRDNINNKEIKIDEDVTLEKVLIDFPMTKNQSEYIALEENKAIFDIVKKWTFKELNKIRIDKDNLVKGKKIDSEDEKKGSKRDPLIQHLFDIQECIDFYSTNRHNEFIKKTDFWKNITEEDNDKKVIKQQHLIALKKNIEGLVDTNNKTIGEVIDLFDSQNIWKKKDRLKEFITKNEYYEHIYEKVRKVPYQEVVNLYNYIEGYTIYSTQHSIKGDEFDNVFIVMDNGKWSKYNFKDLFENSIIGLEQNLRGEEQKSKTNEKRIKDAKSRISVFKRTQKLFYVCCTRAKKNLVVYYYNPTDDVLARAREWFGEDNTKEV